MNGGYGMIACILLYVLLLQTLDAPKMNPGRAAAMFVCGSFAILSGVTMLENAARGLPVLTDIVTIAHAVGYMLQFGVAYGIFIKAEQTDDEYLSFVFWGGLGLALIFFAVPELTGRLAIWL